MSSLSIAEGVRRGEVDPAAVLDESLAAIRRLDGTIHAFLAVTEDLARGQAAAVAEKVRRGEDPGRLAGVPVALKDNLCTRGIATTCASRILEKFVPPYDAHVVQRLCAEGALVVGKTNLDEFAMGSSTENSAFGPTRNPWDPSRIPGGSSGGSGAAVAAGLACLALGSDTGGSIRLPAALCGVYGLKPTYGRVSRWGLVAYASSLDQIGPFARDPEGLGLLLSVIAGPDGRDSTSVPRPVPDYAAAARASARGRVIAIPREFFGKGLDPEVESAVRAAIAFFEREGLTAVEVSIPHAEYAIPAYYLVAMSEASSNLARYDGVKYGRRTARNGSVIEMVARSRAEGFGAEIKRRILLGTHALSLGYKDAFYLKAMRVRTLIRRDLDRCFEQADFVVGPTSPTPAFPLGERVEDPLAMYLADIYTIFANLAGIPALSIPCGLTQAGLPIGLQAMGRPFEEEGLLALAGTWERAHGFAEKRPPIAADPA